MINQCTPTFKDLQNVACLGLSIKIILLLLNNCTMIVEACM